MNKEEYKQRIIDSMKVNGDYDECYDLAIDQLVDLQEMVEYTHKQILANPDIFINHTDNKGNVRRVVNPAYSVFFDLQRAIHSYLHELGLR